MNDDTHLQHAPSSGGSGQHEPPGNQPSQGNQIPSQGTVRLRLDAAAVAHGSGLIAAPGSLLVELRLPIPEERRSNHGCVELRTIAAGPPDALADLHADKVKALPDAVLIPGLVNAHAHLDLTHIGPRPYDPASNKGPGGSAFIGWLDVIRRERLEDPDAIAQSVQLGAAMLERGGVVAVADIAGAPPTGPTAAPAAALAATDLIAVSFIEFFGIGSSAERATQRMPDVLTSDHARAATAAGVVLGLQPHAPTTVDLDVYTWAAILSRSKHLPLSTHLAETPEERRFIEKGTGPQADFLQRMGVWDDTITSNVGKGRHPVAHLERFLRAIKSSGGAIAAHLNDATDEAIEILAAAGTHVAYCPRASAYFAQHKSFGPHRYRDMLAQGVNVCLGTDSVINLPPSVADPSKQNSRISVLDDIRMLHRRDGTDPATLIAMATINGARALRLREQAFTFTPGEPLAGVIALPTDPGTMADAGDPLVAALLSQEAPSLLLSCRNSGFTRR